MFHKRSPPDAVRRCQTPSLGEIKLPHQKDQKERKKVLDGGATFDRCTIVFGIWEIVAKGTDTCEKVREGLCSNSGDNEYSVVALGRFAVSHIARLLPVGGMVRRWICRSHNYSPSAFATLSNSHLCAIRRETC